MSQSGPNDDALSGVFSGLSASQTVTVWIEQLRQGDEEAAQRLWERYFARMVGLARRKLEASPRVATDEEDVALSAFKSFCVGVRKGQFPQLLDRDSLWPLLVAITANKSVDLIRHENRQKRRHRASSEARTPLEQLLSREPTPEMASELSELFERLMRKLDDAEDEDLKLIAVRRMQGESAADIAARLGCVKRTIERKVTLIRRLWEAEGQ